MDRAGKIVIGGEEYEMLLTTKATKEISKRYGGLEKLGEKLMKSGSFEGAIDEIVWLIALLVNQPILVHNLKNPGDKKKPITEEEIELLTSPFELGSYQRAIMDAMSAGTRRDVVSEEDSKNQAAG